MLRTTIIVSLTLGILGLGACGGGDDTGGGAADTSSSSGAGTSGSSTSGAGTSDTGTASSLEPIDVCSLLSDSEVASVGAGGTGEPTPRPSAPNVQWDSCTWGALTDPTALIVQVQQLAPGESMDALRGLLSAGEATGEPESPVSVGEDGALYNVAILGGGGGGGVGKSVSFLTADGARVAVSVTGEDVDVPALTALAERVAEQVG